MDCSGIARMSASRCRRPAPRVAQQWGSEAHPPTLGFVGVPPPHPRYRIAATRRADTRSGRRGVGRKLQLAAARSCAEVGFRDPPGSGAWGGAVQLSPGGAGPVVNAKRLPWPSGERGVGRSRSALTGPVVNAKRLPWPSGERGVGRSRSALTGPVAHAKRLPWPSGQRGVGRSPTDPKGGWVGPPGVRDSRALARMSRR